VTRPRSVAQAHEPQELRGAIALKGHGFSRAEFEAKTVPALADEGRIECIQTIPQGLKPGSLPAAFRHG
jgi:hypothetical protein